MQDQENSLDTNEQRIIVRRKSYTARFKLDAIIYAKIHCNRAVSRHFDIGETSFRELKYNENTLKMMTSQKLAMRFREYYFPVLEKTM